MIFRMFECVNARFRSSFKLAAIICMVLAPITGQAKQFGLVVGIDNYLNGTEIETDGKILNLKGAENDAKLISSVLHENGVDLPAARVLIGKSATRQAFLDAWKELSEVTRPGDTIIVSFAGHGGQVEEVKPPIDETGANGDSHDESLMFYDFDPKNPHVGSILDDELFSLLAALDDVQIVFVADSCHSGGLTRGEALSTNQRQRSRGSRVWEAAASTDDIPDSIAVVGENWDSLDHVTYFLAAQDETETIQEVFQLQKEHGALSVSFAAGISGEADRDQDGKIRKRELEDYIFDRVSRITSGDQTPGVLPNDGENDLLFVLRGEDDNLLSVCTEESALHPLAIQFVGFQPPGFLGDFKTDSSAPLLFKGQGDRVDAFFNGELVHSSIDVNLDCGSSCNDQEKRHWASVLNKFRLVRTVDQCFDPQYQPVSITKTCKSDSYACTNEQKINLEDPISFEFGDSSQKLGEYFVLFSVASTGAVDFLYPTEGDPISVGLRQLPYLVDGIYVGEPIGRDDLIAGFCASNPRALSLVIQNSVQSTQIIAVDKFALLSKEYDCQWGRYPLFTVR